MAERDEVAKADQIVDLLLKGNPKIHQVVADARMFDGLREQPGWQRLYSMVVAKQDKWMQDISKRLMGPKKRWPDSDEIAYHQGFFQGALFVLAHPEYAEKNLERSARLAWNLYGDDNDQQEAIL